MNFGFIQLFTCNFFIRQHKYHRSIYTPAHLFLYILNGLEIQKTIKGRTVELFESFQNMKAGFFPKNNHVWRRLLKYIPIVFFVVPTGRHHEENNGNIVQNPPPDVNIFRKKSSFHILKALEKLYSPSFNCFLNFQAVQEIQK